MLSGQKRQPARRTARTRRSTPHAVVLDGGFVRCVLLERYNEALMPMYQLLENLGAEYLVPHRGELPLQPARTRQARTLAETCVCDEYGRFLHFLKPDGGVATSADLKRGAECWELALA